MLPGRENVEWEFDIPVGKKVYRYLESLVDNVSFCRAYFTSINTNLCFGMTVPSQFEVASSSAKKELEAIIGESPPEPKKRKTIVTNVSEEKKNEE